MNILDKDQIEEIKEIVYNWFDDDSVEEYIDTLTDSLNNLTKQKFDEKVKEFNHGYYTSNLKGFFSEIGHGGEYYVPEHIESFGKWAESADVTELYWHHYEEKNTFVNENLPTILAKEILNFKEVENRNPSGNGDSQEIVEQLIDWCLDNNTLNLKEESNRVLFKLTFGFDPIECHGYGYGVSTLQAIFTNEETYYETAENMADEMNEVDAYDVACRWAIAKILIDAYDKFIKLP